MSIKIKHQSGTTSTFIPGTVGEKGNRSNITFFGTSDASVAIGADSSIRFMIDSNDKLISIYNQYNNSRIVPEVNDFIIYSEPNQTKILTIKDVSNGICDTSIYDIWNTRSIDDVDDNTNVNLIISAISNEQTLYRGFKPSISEPIVSSGSALFYDDDDNKLNFLSYCTFTFNIASGSDLALKRYKVQLEFITDWASPGMDTRIADKFKNPKDYTGNVNYPTGFQKQTFKGYFTNYSCNGDSSTVSYLDSSVCKICGSKMGILINNKGEVWYDCPTHGAQYNISSNYNPTIASMNFDDEKLDNFVVIIKDYDDGVGSMTYTSDIRIPKDVIINASKANHPYKCYAYIYLNNEDKTYKKILLSDMTNSILGAANRDSSIYDMYNATEESIQIPTDETYPGSATIVRIANPGEGNTVKPDAHSSDGLLASDTDKGYPKRSQTQGYSGGTYDTTISASVEIDTYVDNITTPVTSTWCNCYWKSTENKLLFYTNSTNNTGQQRQVTFTFTTSDQFIKRGEHSGKFASSQWTVTVIQNPLSTVGGIGGGGSGCLSLVVDEYDRNRYDDTDNILNRYDDTYDKRKYWQTGCYGDIFLR